MLRKGVLLLGFLLATFSTVTASEGHSEEGKEGDFDAVEMIMHHIQDSYSIHLWGEGEDAVEVPLPVILIDEGVQIFMSSEFEHGHKAVKKGDYYYHLHHNHIYKSKDEHLTVDAEGEVSNGEAVLMDISITKTALYMMLVAAILLWLFVSIANFYKKNGAVAPKGKTSFLEPVILFVRDEIAKPNIGAKYEKFLPYLLTVFFFIWVSNLFGLFPLFGSNITGNIAVTMVLAVLTLIITNVNGNKHYWQHILWMPGIPAPVKIILTPIEIVAIFTKPFALMIRLFANITAGHIIILSLVSIIFIYKNVGMAGLSVPLALFIYVLEILVTALQAYIFTMLTSLFIGGAVAEHH